MDKASPASVLRAISTAGISLLVLAAFMLPHFVLGVLVDAARWNGYRIPICSAAFVMTLNARRIWRSIGRVLARSRKTAETANQSTYHGIPVDELATYLMERKSFKLQDTLDHFKFSQRKYARIAEELEKHAVLVRGESNARVLAEISYAELARQLRDDFPLVWDEISKTWVEKDDPYGRHLREKAFRQRKLDDEGSRKEKKVERLQKQIEAKKEELQDFAHASGVPSAFAQALSYASNGGE
jgi:hypothetical protein